MNHALTVEKGIKGEQVVEAMRRISSIRGTPKIIRVDNGPEFTTKASDRWAYENAVTLDFSRPGNPLTMLSYSLSTVAFGTSA